MSFLSSLMGILLGFLQSLIGMAEADISQEMYFFGSQIAYVEISWGFSLAGYGPAMPLLMAAGIGVTISGSYLVFVFTDGVRTLVGA